MHQQKLNSIFFSFKIRDNVVKLNSCGRQIFKFFLVGNKKEIKYVLKKFYPQAFYYILA